MSAPGRSGRARIAALGAGVVALGALAAVGMTSCSQAATNVPVRTFERATRMDVVCLHVTVPDPNNPGGVLQVPAVPQPQAQCAPVQAGVNGATLPNHLYALVTQTARGEIAVVDLTAGSVVDIDLSTPGINFIPVGALPTDVAVAPDGAIAFIAAAEVNKPALYAINTQDILGDSQGLPAGSTPAPPTLPSLPVCGLPQAPSTVSIVPHGDTYEIAVVLPGDARSSAKVVTLDPAPFLRGAGLQASADGGGSTGPTYAPGQLVPCVVTGTVELSGALPTPGAQAAWPVGLPYTDAGVEPDPIAQGCSAAAGDAGSADAGDAGAGEAGAGDAGAGDAGASDAGANDAGAGDAEADGGDAGFDAGAPDASSAGDAGAGAGEDAGLAFTGPLRPRASVGAVDGTTLYVSDMGVPLVHVLDLSKVGAPVERAPLVATSLAQPTRRVQVGDIAVSPATSDYKKYLYALDSRDGSVMVFDVTDPPTAPRLPLVRPHAELNPFQPADRLAFTSPVAAVSFVRHDFPLTQTCDGTQNPLPHGSTAKSGLLCNPNPNAADTNGAPVTPGTYDYGVCYRQNSSIAASTTTTAATSGLPALGPARLRGVFGFVTLTSGQVVAIDVDDWDAPCRRPDPVCSGCSVGQAFGPPSAVAPGEPAASGPQDIDPYHAPLAFQSGGADTSPVSLEAFFPVSAPNRPRSLYLLRNDPVTGAHAPYLNGPPQLFSQSAALTASGPGSAANPIILPTASTLADPSLVANPTEANPAARTPKVPLPANVNPSLPSTDGSAPPNVRLAFEDPQVHVDQDWTVTYEGPLPGFDGTTLATPVTTTDAYQTLTLANTSALFCRKGVEDARIGAQRAALLAAEMSQQSVGIPVPKDLALRLGDYVQLTDEILDITDPYWQVNPDAGASDYCWDFQSDLVNATPQQRHDVCFQDFGAAGEQRASRDFPILEAYDDRIVIGAFDSNRVHGTSTKLLKEMQCCFHRQVQFKVRTGGMWVAVGSATGYLHHVTTDAGGACVESCDPNQALLNARAPAVPWPSDLKNAKAPGRDSPLAMRNPAFSFVVWDGQDAQNNDVLPQRDYQWKFSTRGQFTTMTVNIASGTTAVSPQSMRFIDSLGQLAVVDGSSQGLVLIDLNSVALAHTPYF